MEKSKIEKINLNFGGVNLNGIKTYLSCAVK